MISAVCLLAGALSGSRSRRSPAPGRTRLGTHSASGARGAEGVGHVILSHLAAEVDARDAGEAVMHTGPDPCVDDLGPQQRSRVEVVSGVEIARQTRRVEAVDVEIDCVGPEE